MSNISTSSVADDLSKNIDHEESSPSYTGLNPLFNQQNNSIQPQVEWRVNDPDTFVFISLLVIIRTEQWQVINIQDAL